MPERFLGFWLVYVAAVIAQEFLSFLGNRYDPVPIAGIVALHALRRAKDESLVEQSRKQKGFAVGI
jgi:hypothetical protein